MTTDANTGNAVVQAHDVIVAPAERSSYSVDEAAQMLGVHSFSVYRMIERGKLQAGRGSRGKILIPREELLKLLKSE